MANLLKKLIKGVVGREGYAVIINTKLGSKVHDKLHSDSSTSRDFLLQLFPKFSIGAEIGVDEGNFSERILEIVRPKKLHLIDPWEFKNDDLYKNTPYGSEKIQNQAMMDKKYESVKKKFESLISKNQVIINRGFSEDISNLFGNGYFDWVYIDGNHLYEFVKKDLHSYLPKIKTGGFMAGDDYYDDGWSKGGVKKAVDEFVNTESVKLIRAKNNQFILQK
jgi:hypothetical protein